VEEQSKEKSSQTEDLMKASAEMHGLTDSRAMTDGAAMSSQSRCAMKVSSSKDAYLERRLQDCKTARLDGQTKEDSSQVERS